MKKRKRVILYAIPLLALSILFSMGAMSQRKPKTLGAAGGRLSDCGDSPNCVCSQATNDAFRVAPLAFGDEPELAWDRLGAAISSMPRAKIVKNEDGYLHAEFRSMLFRFVDDVELLLDTPNNKIDVRSASRLGYSDLGANRKRVDQLRIRFSDMANSELP